MTRSAPGSGVCLAAGCDADKALLQDTVRRLQARLDRERRARGEAERLLDSKALELYEANRALSALAADLELRVEERTRELSAERQRAMQLAEADALTGLANRSSFSRQLDLLLAEQRTGAKGLCAILIDLDDFKAVNDNFGHAAGDALLVETSRRLLAAVRPGDVVARLGGDEFAIIARHVDSPQKSLCMADRLLRSLCVPAVIAGRAVPTSCSIGVTEPVFHDTHAEALLRDADLALYESKRNGRARVTCFNAALRAQVEGRATLDDEVRLAVLEDRIEPWFQPIHRHDAARFVGAEVLARLRMPDGSVRTPAQFLAPVEAMGLLDTMMENMLRHALREARGPALAGTLEYLSINVSPEQFNQGWALTQLPALLAETGFPAQALVVEITETAFLRDIDNTRSMLAALTRHGMRIALDDFGVGYSNFSLLRQLPFSMLKLDRTLICDIETDDHARALAECILELASRLAIKVVAEGVETQRQSELLTAAGCNTMQGYWFARPERRLGTWFPSTPPNSA